MKIAKFISSKIKFSLHDLQTRGTIAHWRLGKVGREGVVIEVVQESYSSA